jgi:hypothetical protein
MNVMRVLFGQFIPGWLCVAFELASPFGASRCFVLLPIKSHLSQFILLSNGPECQHPFHAS